MEDTMENGGLIKYTKCYWYKSGNLESLNFCIFWWHSPTFAP